MNRTEVETLLLRIDATYSLTQPSEVERAIRIEEWTDSALADVEWVDVGRRAWRRWKDTEDRRPSVHQFVEACRLVIRNDRLDRPKLSEAEASPEERAHIAALIHKTRDALKADR